MSKFRYFLGIVAAITVFIVSLFLDFAEGMEKVALAYLLATAVAEVLWWSRIVIAVPFFFLRLVATVFLFWGGLLLSGVIFFIIAIAIAAPVFGFLATLVGIAVTAFLGLSAILFPFHTFLNARDLD